MREVVGSCPHCGAPIYGLRNLIGRDPLPLPDAIIRTCPCFDQYQRELGKLRNDAARRDAEILDKLNRAARELDEERENPDD